MSGSDSDSFLSADEEQLSAANSKTSSPVKKFHVKEKTKPSPDRNVDNFQKQDSGGNGDGKATVPDNSSVQKEENVAEEGDGWDDFDDWEDEGDNKNADEKTTTQAIQNQSSGAHNIPSSYDTFPVLYDLKSDSNKRNAKINPTCEENASQGDIQIAEKTDSSWGWKPWGGMVSFLSNATEGVTTLTSHVSQGLASVLENSIGVPDPEEMARLRIEEEKREKELVGSAEKAEDSERILSKKDSKEDLIRSSVGNILTGVTQIGSKVITGGLDTLEGIGKKTMTILQENDPLLLNKRKFLGLDNDKPVLSQILREAKEKSEETEKNLKQAQKNAYKRQLHFEMLFDHYHGLVHLEALEMLSKQSALKLQSLLEPLTGKALTDMQETLNEVKELCDLGDLDGDDNDGLCEIDEVKEKLAAATEDLGIEVDFSELLKCWSENLTSLCEMEDVEPQEIFNKALRCLAETTALIVHKMHKLAELLLIKDRHSTVNEADSLVQLTTVFCWHLHGIANRFGAKLNAYVTTEETSSLITTIFLEESNSSSYVKSAFQLFIPILQIGAA